MYTAFKLYIHKLQTKIGETMIIIYENKMEVKIIISKFIISEIKEVINIIMRMGMKCHITI